MIKGFYPFTLRARAMPYGVDSPAEFRELFLKSRPESLGWYCYDVIVLSRTEIEFVVRGMANTCSGGIGSEISRLPVTVEPSDTHAVVQRELSRYARQQRVAELEAEEREILRRMTLRLWDRLEADEEYIV